MRLLGLSTFLFATMLLAGCKDKPSGDSTKAGGKVAGAPATKLRVLVIDDEPLSQALGEQASKQLPDEEQPDIRSAALVDLSKAKRLSADVVIFPTILLGSLVESQLIQALPEEMVAGKEETAGDGLPKLPIDDLLPTVRQCEVNWSRRVYAYPLGSVQPVLMYRPDLFAKLELKPPTTWEEYQTVAERLANRESLGDAAPPADRPWHAVLEATAEGWAGQALLYRAASYVRTEGQQYALFDVETMKARIDSPPFVRAAGELFKATEVSGTKPSLTPSEVFVAMRKGECGMAIGWPLARSSDDAKTPLAFAALPGSHDRYLFQESQWAKKEPDQPLATSFCGSGGNLVAVTKEARRVKTAFQFLAWISKQEVSSNVGPASDRNGPFTKSQLAAPEIWMPANLPAEVAVQYSQVVQAATASNMWMPTVRIPGGVEYRTALDAAVIGILKGDAAEASLAKAAQEWNAVTKRFDADSQRRAYQRSLGNDF